MYWDFFDFERMDFDKITNTLIPIKVSENYLFLINRGILICACQDEEMYASTLQSIGISPYLLIPNVVLKNNFYLLYKIEAEIGQLTKRWKEMRKDRFYFF